MKRRVIAATLLVATLTVANSVVARASTSGIGEVVAWAPLHLAAAIGHAPTVRALLAAGADPNVGCGGRTPARVAEYDGRTAVAEPIRSRGGW